MNIDLLVVAALAGAANWAFRVLPLLARGNRFSAGGWAERFFAATGPAAITTLFVAAILPMLDRSLAMPLLVGTLAVIAAFASTRSVVVATLAGALAHGLVVWSAG